MPFYLRKSVSVGPFRFNLSGSGVGVSVGVPGFRVGAGPRGNYIHVGGGGVYYRHSFASTPAPRPSSAERRVFDSASASDIVDSSSEALLEEIREKRRKVRLLPLAIIVGTLGVFVVAGAREALWSMAVAAIVAMALIVCAAYRDRVARTVVVLYDLEPAVEEAFRRFDEWAQALAASRCAWHVAASDYVANRKYHAGANELVERHVTTIRTAAPPQLQTNVPVLSIRAGRQTLYFLPDRLLIYDGAGVGAVSYRTLDVMASKQRFIEYGGVPADATVVDSTWRYVNKSGGPDRRFSVNPQIPICLYDELTLRSPSGLHEVVQVSRSGVAEGFAAAVRHLASVVA